MSNFARVNLDDLNNTFDKLVAEVFGDRHKKVDDEWINDSQAENKISKIDLKRPHGFVGEIVDYVNSQCLFPRQNLAVMAALCAIGNIIGINFKFKNSSIRANLFAFCVAGSTTGKESVLQAMINCHIAARISGAVHGEIKSEQEIIRNLIRNQAAFYVIDEVGIQLGKLTSSTKSGGASYLQGAIGMLMSAYSKSSGNLLISGDLKEVIKKDLKTEYAALKKELLDGHDDRITSRLEKIEHELDNINLGLVNPFLSLCGFTTPSKFNDFVNFEQVTSGMIGRSLICAETDNNPIAKMSFDQTEMSDSMRDQLAMLYSRGHSEITAARRVEAVGNVTEIIMTPEAEECMQRAGEYFWGQAEKHQERTGLEAIPRRGRELSLKIALTLAAANQKHDENGNIVCGLEDVEWAVEYVKRDIELKTMLAYASVKERENPIESMAAKILTSIGEDGITVGRIVNKYRAKKQIVLDAVESLKSKGQIRTEEGQNRFDKKIYTVIYKK